MEESEAINRKKEQARAEARSRRILANAEKRLKIIGARTDRNPILPGSENGEASVYKDDDFPNLQMPQAAYNENMYEDLTDDATAFNPRFNPLDKDEMMFNNLNQMFQQATGNGQGSSAPPKQHKIIESRMHIAILAILVYFFTILYPNLAGGYVFLPLFILEITEVFFLRSSPQTSMVRTMLVLSGVSPEKAEILLKIISIAGNYLKDACIYVFTVVMVHGLCSVLLK